MITINLLPPREVKQLKLLKLKSFLRRRILILSLFAFLVLAVFLGADWFLRHNLETLKQQLEGKKQEVDISNFLELKSKIDEFNQNLGQVVKLQDSHTRFGLTLVELTRLTPLGVRLSSLKLLRQEVSGELTGVAEKRDDLLNFQEKLSKSDFFESIESPLSNLTSRDNVEFLLRFKIKAEALK